jgi:PAS domain S-box-containing protein
VSPVKRGRPSKPQGLSSRVLAETFDLDDFVRHSACGYHSLDGDGAFVAVNDTELEWLGYRREELVGKKTFRDLLTADSQALFDREFPRFKTRGRVTNLEFELVSKTGQLCTVLLNATAVVDAAGTYVASRSTLVNITERKRAERERDRFFVLSRDLFAVASGDGYFKRLNPAFADALGWSLDELLARPFLEFVHPDDRAATIRAVERQVLAGEPVQRFRNRYRHKDGSWRWLSWTSMPQPDGLMFATARDETDLVQAAEALQRSEESLAVTLNSIGDGVLTTDNVGRITHLNPVATGLTGWTVAEALGRPVHDVLRLITEHTRESARIPIDEVLATGKTCALPNHTVLVARDGREVPIADSAAPIRAAGRTIGVVVVFRDIRREREAERRTTAAMRDLNDLKTALDEHAIVTLTDAHGRITYANDKFSATFEYSRDELVGRNHRVVNSGFHPKEFFAGLWSTILDGRVWQGEIRNRSKNGRVGWFATTIVPFLSPDGRPAQFVAIQTDITARKQAEDDVRRFNAELEHLIEARTSELQRALAALQREKIFSDNVIQSVSGFFYVINQDGYFVRWNRASNDIFGLSDEEMPRTHALALIDDGDVERAAGNLREAFVAGQTETELRLKGKDGIRHALLSARRVELDGAVYLVGTGVDITARKAAEAEVVAEKQKVLALNADLERRVADRTKELELARQAADSANRAKSAFLANMSHEIRTPLNAIAGMVELLEHVRDPADRAKMLRVTEESTRALAGIIDDVLDLSKIEAGILDVVLEPVSIRDVVASVVEAFASSASAKNLYLRQHVDAGLPAAVRCDWLRLRQILFNLLGNAIKFTAEGGVEIRASLLEETPTTARIQINVTDTGIGIAPEAQAKLFQPFVQADVDTTRKFGGTGLGLTISRRLAGLLGGTLTLASEIGRGTTASLVLTLALAEASELPVTEGPGEESLPPVPQAAANAAGRKFLLVDDSAINRQVLQRQLAVLGYAADEAGDGREALQMWQQGDYAMLIADCHMPGMDGYELTRSVRRAEAAEGTRPRTPIVGYTANAGKDSRDLCLAAGMDDVLVKPVGLRTLSAKVIAWLQVDAAVNQVTDNRVDAADESTGPIDVHELLDITGGDQRFAREMLAAFVAQKSEEFRHLAEGLAMTDLTEVAHLAHRLRGAAWIVAARRLARICELTETAARAGDRSAAVEAAGDLLEEFERVRAHAARAEVTR